MSMLIRRAQKPLVSLTQQSSVSVRHTIRCRLTLPSQSFFAPTRHRQPASTSSSARSSLIPRLSSTEIFRSFTTQLSRDRTIQELAPNGDIPGTRNGAFDLWFDQLTVGELEALWKVESLREKIKARLRHPGKLHEWCMVSQAPIFKKWGVSISTMRKCTTPTKDIQGVNPDWVHGGEGSTSAHNELIDIILACKSFDEFKERLNSWSDKRLKNGRKDLPPELQLPT